VISFKALLVEAKSLEKKQDLFEELTSNDVLPQSPYEMACSCPCVLL
jgi:hypothetical protein